MADIYFAHKNEALSFCDYLFAQKEEIRVQWNYHKKWGHVVHVEKKNGLEDRIVQGLIHVFVLHRERSWITDIIRTCYYFSDDDEVAHIYEICGSLLGSVDDNDPYHHGQHLERLAHLFTDTLQKENGVGFDSVITFRFQDYYDELIELVGEAIDEYKREQEYQTYIQQLREYLQVNESKVEHLYVLQSQPFLFYTSSGRRYSREEIQKVTKDHPLYLFGLGEDEVDLTPIMALAPHKISVFGNDPTDPKTLTVLNVFQERAEFYPLKKFPYKRLSPF